MTQRTRLVPEGDFDKPGAQYGFLRLFHSVHSSAYGYIPIPIVVLRNGEGPTALLVSGTHGDEYEGQVALCNLARSLKPEMIQGRVIILPAANLPAALADPNQIELAPPPTFPPRWRGVGRPRSTRAI